LFVYPTGLIKAYNIVVATINAIKYAKFLSTRSVDKNLLVNHADNGIVKDKNGINK
jgi:hypothetical protein